MGEEDEELASPSGDVLKASLILPEKTKKKKNTNGLVSIKGRVVQAQIKRKRGIGVIHYLCRGDQMGHPINVHVGLASGFCPDRSPLSLLDHCGREKPPLLFAFSPRRRPVNAD